MARVLDVQKISYFTLRHLFTIFSIHHVFMSNQPPSDIFWSKFMLNVMLCSLNGTIQKVYTIMGLVRGKRVGSWHEIGLGS